MIYCITVLFVILISFVFQEFTPEFTWAYYAKLLIVHAVFYASAVSVPFPVMLLYALVAGFVWDCRWHMSVSSLGESTTATQVDLNFGFTILIFGLLGLFIQGVRPFFRQKRWGLPVLMVGVCTFLGMFIEHLVLSFHRGDFAAPPELWLKLLMSALFSTLLAPFLLLFFSRIAAVTGYKMSMEGITRRYNYHGDQI